jgi:hypothetical protein
LLGFLSLACALICLRSPSRTRRSGAGRHHLAYVRKRCWDFLVRELTGAQPPAYRPAPIAIDPSLLGELFA